MTKMIDVFVLQWSKLAVDEKEPINYGVCGVFGSQEVAKHAASTHNLNPGTPIEWSGDYYLHSGKQAVGNKTLWWRISCAMLDMSEVEAVQL